MADLLASVVGLNPKASAFYRLARNGACRKRLFLASNKVIFKSPS